MSKPRRQHYIPVSYLTRFASENKICVTDLVQKKRYWTSLQNVAQIRDFYSINIDDESKESVVEKYFSDVEGKASRIIDKFVRTMKLPEEQDLAHLAEFVAGMHLRVPDLRKKYLEMSQYTVDLLNHLSFSTREAYERTCERYYQDTGKKIDMPYEKMKEIAEDPGRYRLVLHQHEYILIMLKMIPKIAEVVIHMTPSLLIATERARFITSDNPVILIDTDPKRPKYLGYGWLNQTVQAYFPLSPFTCLAFAWQGEYRALPANDRAVSTVNSYLAWFSTRYVFSKDERIFWHKDKKVNCQDNLFFDEFAGSKKNKPASVVSGPIPQTIRPFDLSVIRKSAYEKSPVP